MEAVHLRRHVGIGILGMDLVVADIDLHMRQVPALSTGIHANGHRRARPQPGGQEAVRGHPAIRPPVNLWLVGHGVVMGPIIDVLQEPVRVGFRDPDDAFGRVQSGFGRVEPHVARGPGRDNLGRVFGVGGLRDQVIRIVERHKALGMLGRLEDARGVVDADDLVAGGMQDEKRAAQITDGRAERAALDILHEFAADGESPGAERHLRRARVADAVEGVIEIPGDMRRVEGGRDGHHRLGRGDIARRAQDRRAAQGMADQELRRRAQIAQVLGRTDEIVHVRGKGRVREFPLGMPEAGEVEPHHGDAHSGKALRDAARGEDVLPAGEAMREERGGQPGTVRQIQPRGQLVALVAGEGDAFGRHGSLPRLGGSKGASCRAVGQAPICGVVAPARVLPSPAGQAQKGRHGADLSIPTALFGS